MTNLHEQPKCVFVFIQNITGLQVTNPTFSTQVQMSWRSIIDSSPSGILKSDSNRSINARTSALATRLSQLDFESDTTSSTARLNQVLWAFEWDKQKCLPTLMKFWGKARALPPFVLPNHNGEYFQRLPKCMGSDITQSINEVYIQNLPGMSQIRYDVLPNKLQNELPSGVNLMIIS
ncbi:hypothetical protein T265_11792 [Opisthorchis viverrini]|uniref:Uncharacterized protein n=1 Tax=Opisthorchis viverrini TaxID=6198 RepID=A0A074YXP4_OPIVI|nr:hypothetical protein T265_11792 [Opisthorchis viverrini]KER19438.1 hypothetical protein T265_11792 [Opisthorchis viverrini]